MGECSWNRKVDHQTRKIAYAARVLAASLALTLAACGGGGSGGVAEAPPPPVENSAPTADAGSDQNVATGTQVTLDGSGSSDADGDTLTYSWSFTSVPSGSAASLTGANTAAPRFSTDVDGTYVVALTVDDGEATSAADQVTITASTANSAPTADAGSDQNVATGTQVTLDGSGSSDADGDTLTYSWSFTSVPSGSAASLSGASTITPTFTPDVDGDYVVQLVVNDGDVDSAPDQLTVMSATQNSPPMADAGPNQEVISGSQVTLNGTGSSDADGDSLSHEWSFVSKPTGSAATLAGSNSISPQFTADLEGTFVVQLVVNDGSESSAPDQVTVTATDPYIRLEREGGSFFDPGYDNVSFPYSSNGSTSVNSSPPPAEHELEQFRITAVGSDFTVDQLIAVDRNGVVAPRFDGLSNSLVLQDGLAIEFRLMSPRTNGATADLLYYFEIQETGESFVAQIMFESN